MRELSPWERAYAEFETPEEEIAKFTARLLAFGAKSWPRDTQIVELFCGRGNGLQALARLGFTHLEGIDLSETLIAEYAGAGQCRVGDCRRLPYASASKDVLVVQGGLHHLQDLPADLEQTLAEAARVLRPDGRLVVVEPWQTPFLQIVHRLCESGTARRFSRKLRALSTMIEYERQTYEQWLRNPALILDCFGRFFVVEQQRIRHGKLLLAGRPRKR